MTGAPTLTPVQGNPFGSAPGSSGAAPPMPPPMAMVADPASPIGASPTPGAPLPADPQQLTQQQAQAQLWAASHGRDVSGVSSDQFGPLYDRATLTAAPYDPFGGEGKMPWGEDVARTIPGAAARGVTGIGGMGGDLDNLGQNGFNSIADRLLGVAQDATGHDFGLPHHPHSPTVDRAAADFIPTSANLNDAVQGVTGAYHQPQSWQARTADTAVLMAPLMVGGEGGLPARLARALVPTATSSVAGEAFHGSPYEGVARLGGAIAGSGGLGMLENIAAGPQVAASRYLNGYTPEQISGATQFMRAQAANGLDVSPLEALTHTAGGSANQLQHYVTNSYHGQPLMQPFFDARPGQVKGVAANMADLIAPPYPGGPGMLGQDTQRASEGLLQQLEQARTAHVALDYKAADPVNIPAGDVESILARIDGQIANDKTGLLQSPLGQLRDRLTASPATEGTAAVAPQRVQNGASYQMVGGSPAVAATPRVPITDIENLDRVRKYFRDRMTMPPLGSDAFTKEQAGAIGAHLTDLDAAMEQVPAFAAGKDKFQQFTRSVIDPANASELGPLSRTTDVGAQTGAIFPPKPHVGGIPSMTGALTALPNEVAGGLTRQHVLDSADSALADLRSGENPWAGSALAQRLTGTPERGARFQAGVGAVAGQPAADQIASYLDGLRATGKNIAQGSGTQFNAERAAALGASPAPVRFLGGALDPLEWGKHFDKAVGGAMFRNRIEGLADFLSSRDPDAAEQFMLQAQRRGKVNPMLPALLNAPDASRKP